MMFASTGDARFRDRVNYIVNELELCQRAEGNGYVAAIPNGKRIFREVAAGDIRSQGLPILTVDGFRRTRFISYSQVCRTLNRYLWEQQKPWPSSSSWQIGLTRLSPT